MLVSLTLQSITCHSPSGMGATGSLNDEVIVVVQPDASLPISLPGGGLRKNHPMDGKDLSVWQIDRDFQFERDLLITLYDHDESLTRTRSDYLISQVYTPDSLPTSVRLKNKGNGADYTITVAIHA